jgi:hypothetical protein
MKKEKTEHERNERMKSAHLMIYLRSDNFQISFGNCISIKQHLFFISLMSPTKISIKSFKNVSIIISMF